MWHRTSRSSQFLPQASRAQPLHEGPSRSPRKGPRPRNPRDSRPPDTCELIHRGTPPNARPSSAWVVWKFSRRLPPPSDHLARSDIWGPLANRKSILVGSPGRSCAVGSGIAPSRNQTIGQRSVHPLSIMASAIRHGIPIAVLRGTPRPLASTGQAKPPSPILAVVSNRLPLPRVVRIP